MRGENLLHSVFFAQRRGCGRKVEGMKLTDLLRMKLPEGKDPVNVEDFNDNFRAIDKELQNMQTEAGDASKNTVTFATAAERTNVASTESLGTLMGKIAKWFTDMKSAAFAAVANNETTNAEGYVLDARIGKKHSDQLNGLYFGTDANGKWGFKTSQGGTVTPFRNPTGNAAAADVLSGKIFSSAALENAAGAMPNNGAWTGATSGNGNVAIPAGYHNGSGYVSGAGAYNKGVSDADGRVNTESASYKSGYANGRGSMCKVYYLGTGKSFSATGIPGYQNLTADNFLIRAVDSYSNSAWYHGTCGLAGGGNADFYAGGSIDVHLNKSYDASSGKLTCSFHVTWTATRSSWQPGNGKASWDGSDASHDADYDVAVYCLQDLSKVLTA